MAENQMPAPQPTPPPSKPARPKMRSFDEQLWPVNVALLVLTGFVAGIIIAAGGFDDPRFLHNGWVRLVSLAISMALLLVATVKFKYAVGRRLQLAALVSLILHVGVAVLLRDQYWEMAAAQHEQDGDDKADPREPVTMPEYANIDFSQPTPVPIPQPVENQITAPVPTQTPQVEPDQVVPTEKQPQQPGPVREARPTETPDQLVVPGAANIERQPVAAPHRSDQTSKLSKQTELARQTPQAAVDIAEPKTPGRDAVAGVTSPLTPAQRTPAEMRLGPQNTLGEPQTPVQAEGARAPNRANPQQTEVAVSATPTLPRKIGTPSVLPRADAPRDVAARSAQRDPAQVEAPNPTMVVRSQASGPAVARPVIEPGPRTSATVATPEPPRQQPADVAPSLARTDRPSPNRRAIESVDATATPAAPRGVGNSTEPSAQPVPRPTSVARGEASGPGMVRGPLEPGNAAPGSPAPAVSVGTDAMRSFAGSAPELVAASAPRTPRAVSQPGAVGTGAALPAAAIASNQPTTAGAPGPRSTEVPRIATNIPSRADGPPSAGMAGGAPAATGAPAVAPRPAAVASATPGDRPGSGGGTGTGGGPGGGSGPSGRPQRGAGPAVAIAGTAQAEGAGVGAGTGSGVAGGATVSGPSGVAVGRGQSAGPGTTGAPGTGGTAVDGVAASPGAGVASRQPGYSGSAGPSLGQAQQTVPGRRADSGAGTLAGAGAADAPATGIAMSESRGGGVPGPVSQQLARAAAQVPGAAGSQPEAASSPRVEQGSGVAATVGARAANASAPSLTAGSGNGAGLGGTGPSGSAPRRAAQPSALAAGGTAAEGVASTGGTGPAGTGGSAQASVGPAGVAVGRGASAAVGGTGTGGVGGESGVALPAGPASSTALAEGGPRRVATTPGVAGPIGTPGEAARIARGIAGSGVASATALAQDVAVGDIAGSREPALASNPANSDVARGVATGPVGGNIGGAGDATIPGGAPQTIANIGGGPATGAAGRGAGGDQPTVDGGGQAGGGAGVPRAGSGGAALAAATADNVGGGETGSGGAAGAGAGPVGPALADEGKRSAGGGALLANSSNMTPGAGAPGEVGGGTGVATIARAGSGAAGGGGQPEVGSSAGGPGVVKASGGGAVALATTAADVGQPGVVGTGEAGGGNSPQPQVAGVGTGDREPGGGPTIIAQSGSGAAAGAEGVPASVATSALARAGQPGDAVGGGQPEIGSGSGDLKLARTAANAAVAGGTAAADVAAPAGPIGAGGRGVGEGGGPQLAANAVGGGDRTEGGLPTGVGVGGENVAVAEGGGGVDVAAGPIQRAGSTDALPGVEAGGGTAQPARGQPRPAAALAAADVPQNESIPQQGGAPVGEPLDAPGTEVARIASGIPGKVTAGTPGAEGALVSTDAPDAGAIGSQASMSKVSSGNAPTLAVGNGADAAAPLKKGNVAILPGGVATDVADPNMAVASAGGGEGDGTTPGVTVEVGLAERTAGTVPVRVVATAGPGGLGDTLTTDVGIPGRRSQSDGQVVHQVPERFISKKTGGASVVGGMARDEAPAFAKRGRRTGESPGGLGKTVFKTDAQIEGGVDFLSQHQRADGSWSFNYGEGRPGFENESAVIHSDTAATGLCLLTYLGAGYDHYDDKHQERVKNALSWLIRHQQPSGDLYVPSDQGSNAVAQLYSHGIATIALCEAYGMTQDPEVGKAAQKAIDFIVSAQHKERGGWRYTPNYMADLSVSGWQLMALKTGELSGLNVPKTAYDQVQKFLDLCTGAKTGGALYVYNPYAADTLATRHGREPSTVMTSVGLLMRMYTGWNRTTPQMQRGAQHLLENLPQIGSANNQAKTGTFANPMRDTYYWYYATQVMFHMKGDYWKTWNERLRPLLLESQVKKGIFAGSWDPKGPVPDKWGPQGGRIYVTTMNLLSLEVDYRHLRIYESTAK